MYESTRLTDQSEVDPSFRYKKCALPTLVDDPRFPPATIKYICAIHNHPYGNSLSEDDIASSVYRWSRVGGKWACRKTGIVTWRDAKSYSYQEVDESCPDFTDVRAP